MKISKTICFLIIIIISYCSPLFAKEFKVRGFKQGMTHSEVEKFSSNYNYILKEDQLGVGVYRENEIIIYLQFCNDRLVRAFWIVSGKFDKFVRQLEHLEKEGLHKKDVGWRTMIGYDGQEHYDLSVYFTENEYGGDYYVTATLFANEDSGTSNYQITYEGINISCD